MSYKGDTKHVATMEDDDLGPMCKQKPPSLPESKASSGSHHSHATASVNPMQLYLASIAVIITDALPIL
eukprot:1160495-Pelagomonas_calceolata.AAC.14